LFTAEVAEDAEFLVFLPSKAHFIFPLCVLGVLCGSIFFPPIWLADFLNEGLAT
jgi:hypothetical protein